MLAAVKGYYDGTQIVVDEKDLKSLNIGDEVIITILGRINTSEKRTDEKKIGVAKGKFAVPDNIDGCNDEIADMFGGTQ